MVDNATADIAAAKDDGDVVGGDDIDDNDEYYFAGLMTSSEMTSCKMENEQ